MSRPEDCPKFDTCREMESGCQMLSQVKAVAGFDQESKPVLNVWKRPTGKFTITRREQIGAIFSSGEFKNKCPFYEEIKEAVMTPKVVRGKHDAA